MSAAIHDIVIEQGATFTRQITMKQSNGDPMDLTGYTGRAMIRKRYSSATPTAEFTVTIADDPLTGVIILSLSATDTAAIPAGESVDSSESQYVWDFELEAPNGNVDRILQGTCQISPEATK